MQAIVHIIGHPGAGKTTLIAKLLPEFCDKGLCVGTLKHSSHAYELDKPGKDSHVHRKAGANPAAMVNAEMAALYFPASEFTCPDRLIKTHYSHAQLVLIEGWVSGPWPKIEIRRENVGKAPLSEQAKNVCALVCDKVPVDAKENSLPVFALDDIKGLADYICRSCITNAQ